MMDNADIKPQSVEDRVRQLIKDKNLKEESLSDALAIQDKEFATGILAALSRTTIQTVEKILALEAPKPVIALCWKAGLSMRMCLRIQQELAHLPVKEQIIPKGGTDYPLDEKEIKWQLEFLGIQDGM